MKDENGLYYYPFPQNKRVRMYVRKSGNSIQFRLWNADDPELWEEHGWVPHEAIEQAKTFYKGEHFDPGTAYDFRLARALLRDEED